MEIFSAQSRIIVTCSNRLAAYVQKEIESAGLRPQRTFKTGVELFGTMAECIRLNLRLRCASQVLFSVKEFRAVNADELYQAAKIIPWEKIIPADGYFSVSSHVNNETITNNLFANVKVKDAIADRFRELTGSRPDSGPLLSHTVVHLHWQDDRAEIFLDTSGETLAKHGYRRIPGKAPMMESLAAAVLYATSWNRNTPFINPMCGSGTLAIEAAMMVTNRCPGLYRDNYAFKHVLGYSEEIYKTAFRAMEQEVKDCDVRVVATDISADAINIAKINAGVAGVEEMIRFEQCDFRETPLDAEADGVIIFNPEYGERLGEETELAEIYSALGDFMKQKCKGLTGYIFTGNPALAKKIGLKPKRRVEFYNGKIDCRLLEYELYAGTKRVVDPIL